MHKDDAINETSGKPDMIEMYNSSKGGVDTVDKLCAQYNCARNTRRWPMVVFYSILNVSAINASVIHLANNRGSKPDRRKFLEELALSLIYDYQRERAAMTKLPTTLSLRLKEICGLQQEGAPLHRNPGQIGRCAKCGWRRNRKTKYSCQTCGQFLCLEHVTAVCMECYI